VTTTTAPTKPRGHQKLEPTATDGAVCAVPGPFTLIDRHGCEVLFRPLVPADRPTMARLYTGLSAQTRFRRFNSLYTNLTDKQLTTLFDLDYRDRFAWAVEITCDDVTTPVAVGRYAPTSGEVDVVLPLSGIIGQLTDHPLSRMLTTAFAVGVAGRRGVDHDGGAATARVDQVSRMFVHADP
jgi:hypothetical protein